MYKVQNCKMKNIWPVFILPSMKKTVLLCFQFADFNWNICSMWDCICPCFEFVLHQEGVTGIIQTILQPDLQYTYTGLLMFIYNIQNSIRTLACALPATYRDPLCRLVLSDQRTPSSDASACNVSNCCHKFNVKYLLPPFISLYFPLYHIKFVYGLLFSHITFRKSQINIVYQLISHKIIIMSMVSRDM